MAEPNGEILIDKQYNFVKNGRVEHDYQKLYPDGSTGGVEIVHSLYTASILAAFCSPKTSSQRAKRLLSTLYQPLLDAASAHFPTEIRPIETRMAKYVGSRANITHPIVRYNSHFSVCALLRAGVIPTETVSELLSRVPGTTIYQDWITADRKTNERGEIIGAEITGKKITTPKGLGKDTIRILGLPDPMGATASTDTATMDTYANDFRSEMGANAEDEHAAVEIYHQDFKSEGGIHYFNGGVLALHLIITPDYVRKMAEKCPNVKIIALRCDRGLSEPEILETKLGTYPEREKGLTDKGYIVAGAGDIGELLNKLEGPRL